MTGLYYRIGTNPTAKQTQNSTGSAATDSGWRHRKRRLEQPRVGGGALVGAGAVLVGQQRCPVVAFYAGDGHQIRPDAAVEEPLDGCL